MWSNYYKYEQYVLANYIPYLSLLLSRSYFNLRYSAFIYIFTILIVLGYNILTTCKRVYKYVFGCEVDTLVRHPVPRQYQVKSLEHHLSYRLLVS